jgi:hypothetical protein
MACAPKLIRRTNGVVGAVLAESSSSTAFSSIESDVVVEILPRRRPNGAEDCGEVPESPSVVTDSRLLWSLPAADMTISLVWPLPAEVELLRWKRLENAAEVTEPRRLPFGGGLAALSLDILGVADAKMCKGKVMGVQVRASS